MKQSLVFIKKQNGIERNRNSHSSHEVYFQSRGCLPWPPCHRCAKLNPQASSSSCSPIFNGPGSMPAGRSEVNDRKLLAVSRSLQATTAIIDNGVIMIGINVEGNINVPGGIPDGHDG